MSSATEVNTKSFSLEKFVEKHGNNIGFVIPPQTFVRVEGCKHPDTGKAYSFHMTNACLGADAVNGERAILTFSDLETEEAMEIITASLSAGVHENAILDIIAEGDFMLGNPNPQSTSIHILGRLEADDDEDENDEDYEEQDEEDDDDDAFGGFLAEDDDEEEEEEDDEEEDEYPSNSRVTIEQLDDEEGEESKQNGHDDNRTKRPKLEPTKSNGSTKPALTPKKSEKSSEPVSVKKVPAENNKEKDAKTLKKELPATKEDKEMKGKSEPKSDVEKSSPEAKVSASQLVAFLKEELSKTKSAKGSDLGSAIAKKFSMPFKKMGFEEKTITKFIEAHGPKNVIVENDTFKLK